MATTLLIAEDHVIMRQGLKAIIGERPGLDIVGETGDGLEAVQLTRELEPDVLIVDLSMPSLDGREVIRRVKKHVERTRAIVLSSYANDHFVVEALEAGAMAYVLKDETAEDLLLAIERVQDGRRFLSPSLPASVFTTYGDGTDSPSVTDRYETLTPREREILQLLGEGFSGPEIAEKLFISPRTVDKHRANLMEKLDLHSQTDLVHYTIQRGLVEPRPLSRRGDN